MAARPRDWLKQAERATSYHARHSLAAETYEWACFGLSASNEKGGEGSLSALGCGFLGACGVSAA